MLTFEIKKKITYLSKWYKVLKTYIKIISRKYKQEISYKTKSFNFKRMMD